MQHLLQPGALNARRGLKRVLSALANAYRPLSSTTLSSFLARAVSARAADRRSHMAGAHDNQGSGRVSYWV